MTTGSDNTGGLAVTHVGGIHLAIGSRGQDGWPLPVIPSHADSPATGIHSDAVSDNASLRRDTRGAQGHPQIFGGVRLTQKTEAGLILEQASQRRGILAAGDDNR